ncbi:MAG: membrane protein insertase YidC [Candidatus Omnitrophica bacterium]|nr:membrane protein insertase YidC [Candidatus Omnitrophota bacterium]
MEKKLIIAIALSILVIVSFQYFMPKPIPTAVAPATQETAANKPIEIIPPVEPKNLPEEKTTEALTGKYILTFSNIGGSIKEIKLLDYKGLDSKEPLTLVNVIDPKEYICNISDVKGAQVLDLAGYSLKGDGAEITYVLFTKDFEIRKKYILRKSNYGIDLEISIKNLTSSPKEFAYNIIGGAGLTERNAQDKRLIEASSNIGGKLAGIKRPRQGGRTTNMGMVGWEALKNKYFSVILKPFTQTQGNFAYEDMDGNLVIGLEIEKTVIQPGATVGHKYSLYAGPSNIPDLKQFGYGVEESVNYGFFGGISKLLIAVLKMCYMLVHNWGLSIILLSVLLNVILFPLTMKSFKSMQKMQELHPQMEKLKVQYKDQPQKLNKEIMELYKKYNINPFSGCLPILLQMPIFIALYQALMKSIELRNAGFLWIRDLSSPEAIPIPISFPIIGNTINILPLIMVGTMVVQQKISTASAGSAITDEQKQQQKIMLIIMPIMFGFIFYNMPSGLVLYWVVNTILTIVEQASLLRKEA